MNQISPTASWPPEQASGGQSHTRLHGYKLWLVRAGWLAILLLVSGLFAATLPHAFRDIYSEWQVVQARPAAATIFATYTGFLNYLLALRMATVVVFWGTAAILAWRKSDDWFVLYVSATLLMMSYLFAFQTNVNRWRFPPQLLAIFPGVEWAAPLLFSISFFLLFYLFPDGRFRPRWIGAAVIAGGAATLNFLVGSEQRLGLPEEWGWTIFVYSVLLVVIVGLLGQALKWRRATLVQKQQTRLVLFALATFILLPVIEAALGGFSENDAWGHFLTLHLFLLGAMLIPLAIGVSVLRFRLWEAGVLLNRTLLYGLLTALVLALYGLGVGIFSIFLPGRANLLVTVVAVGVAAAAAVPARRLLQRQADRWLPAPPPPPAGPEATVAASKTDLRWRLAHAAWVSLFTFLLWQLVVRLSEMPDILGATETDYLVVTSLQLLPATAAAPFVAYVTALRIGVTAVFWLTAIVIFWRKRSEWFALYVSFLLMLAPFVLVLGGSDNGLLTFISFAALGAQLFLPFLFPDGRFVPRSTRWRVALIGLLLLTPAVTFPIMRLVRADYEPGEWVYGTVMSTMAVIMAAGLASQVYRYRRVAGVEQRQQMKWVLVGFAVAFLWAFWLVLWLGGILTWLNIAEAVTALVMLHLTILASAALPVAIGFSILRYRLWQVDIFVNRALVYGGLTLLVTAVYILVVGIMSTFFQSDDSVLLTVLATGLIAILFTPLRQRLQAAVNRLMYGERDDPATVLARLGKRLEETAVPGEMLPTLVQTIAQTLKLPYVAIEIDGTIVAADGAERRARLYKYPLIYQSQPIGHLLVAGRAGGEAFTPNEDQLLGNVARQAGPAVHAEQLTDQLQRSRQRLVTTREEERRRLRRDLHDGLGPQLATLAVKVGAAQNLLREDVDAAEQLLSEVKAESQNAIKEIRRVVHGLRPSALDQLGLLSALREFAAQNGSNETQITLQAPDVLPALPAAVEVAAYRIATEAITNAVRHAQARNCTLNLDVNETLDLEIGDDGDGLPTAYEPGVGLSSMRERALELGGTFDIQSAEGQGTMIIVRLPLPRIE